MICPTWEQSAGVPQPCHEEAVQAARVGQHAGQGANLTRGVRQDASRQFLLQNRVDGIAAVICQEPSDDILAFRLFQGADRIDQQPAGPDPVGRACQQLGLLVGTILDMSGAMR